MMMSNISFRQQGEDSDQQLFRSLLHHLSHGKVTDLDLHLLRSRQRVNLTVEEQREFSNAIYLFSTNDSVRLHNRKQLRKHFTNIVIIENSIFTDDKLELAIGCPVLLNRNIIVEFGLCNGARGSVVDIVFETEERAVTSSNIRRNKTVKYILVDFKNYTGTEFVETEKGKGVPIFRINEPFEYRVNGVYPMVSRFPLLLSYALTIHRVQGLTLDRIVLTLGKRQMCSCLDYVAISRIRSLKHLMIEDKQISKSRFQDKTYTRMKSQLVEEDRLNKLYLDGEQQQPQNIE